MFSNMVVALYMLTLNLAMHPRAGRGQHNHSLLGRFRFSFSLRVTPTHTVRITATMADG
jgi:hypothetical protein